MRRRQRITQLQKPKRIRKNKKDFLRGQVVRSEPKVMYDNARIPLPYILLFLALSGTIIGYTSLNFLLTKIHVNTPSLLNPFFAYLSTMKLPHVTLPSITIPAIPMPSVAIPSLQISLPTIHVSLPSISIDLSPLFTWIEQSVRQTIPAIISFMNPFPFWTEVFSTTKQAMIVSFVWFFSFIQSMHPVETTGNGMHSLGLLFEEYLATVSVWFSIAIQSIIQFCSLSLRYLTGETIYHIQTLTESLFISWQLIETIALFVINMQTNLTLLCISGIKIFFLETFTILVTIVNAFVFVGETIALFIWHGLVATFDWCINVLLAIKKSIDQILTAIAAVIHLGDPLYRAIGDSINELFIGMGAVITFMPKILK